jgi:uncharacterized protein (DUF1778 family)
MADLDRRIILSREDFRRINAWLDDDAQPAPELLALIKRVEERRRVQGDG